ncbi:LytR/AlgR family response regulator transcription factor [Anaerobium acetethylicum]|uniref:Stage 0 sporulation protein A homolog n=1 Tax=Anaerobium acetethylicum TaxID=1619234 RepID=A0A1D3TSP4_9FIRM|nr:LytTR family DNA-binding domain-containing protein [Anaerobium acetethylicum]SCP96899.1 two-component system, LytT family, response regulator LytT [Anaerobium acetethylicum]
MKVAIIDDEKPARSELSYLIREAAPEAIITEIENGETALEILSNERFDLLCIDINLGDISGTVLAATARKILPDAEIVFATAYNNYAEKAFEIDAIYYLLKPFSAKKVTQMLDKYSRKKQAHSAEASCCLTSKIPVTVDKKILLLDISEIVYIESQNRICIIHTRSGEYRDCTTLSCYEDKLSTSGFFRIQKSYLINMKYASEIYPWFNGTFCVKMAGFETANLPVSRTQIKTLKKLFGI